MMLITKQTDYSIRILGSMAGDRDAVHTTTELAEKLKIAGFLFQKMSKKSDKQKYLFPNSLQLTRQVKAIWIRCREDCPSCLQR